MEQPWTPEQEEQMCSENDKSSAEPNPEEAQCNLSLLLYLLCKDQNRILGFNFD